MADETRQKIIIPRKGISTGKSRVRGLNSPLMNAIATTLGGTDGRTISRASNVDPTTELSDAAKQWLWEHHDLYSPYRSENYQHNDMADSIAAYIDRVSASEKVLSQWWADLLPVNGPVLGPFDSREIALAEEEKWLHEHHIPVCHPCRE